MKDELIMKFSRRLRKLREEYHYTQQQLSELADIEYKHIQRLESNKSCDIKLTTLNKLAKAFKLPLSKFLDFK